MRLGIDKDFQVYSYQPILKITFVLHDGDQAHVQVGIGEM